MRGSLKNLTKTLTTKQHLFYRRGALAFGVGLASLAVCQRAQALPPDVRANHWAARGVQESLDNGVMSTQPDGQFHGEAKVTHAQAVMALAKLARAVEEAKWHAAKSQAVPVSIVPTLQHSDWRKQAVTRYILATLLARFGDYLTNGVTRAPADSKDTGKSEALPSKPVVKIPSTHPAYASLTYLAEGHMIWPGSPLLTADSLPVKGLEMSRALAEMATGVTDHLTSLGQNPDGSTPDASFHHKKP